MKKNVLVILFFVFFSFLRLEFSHAEETAQEKPAEANTDTILINVITEVKLEGVPFEHKRHIEEFKVNCTDCHHLFNERTEAKPKPCVECHDFSEYKLIDGRRVSLIKNSLMKNIYHDQCNSCHEKLQRKGKPFPQKCFTCHPNKEKGNEEKKP